MSVSNESIKIVNTSWMQQGSTCWVPVNEKYKLRCNFTLHHSITEPVANPPMYMRAHIQKLNPTRTFVKLLYMEQHKGPEEVETKDVIRANIDFDKFPEGNLHSFFDPYY